MKYHRNKLVLGLIATAITLLVIYVFAQSNRSTLAIAGDGSTLPITEAGGVNLSTTECGEDASGLQISYRPVTYEFTPDNRLAFTLELSLMKAKRPQQYTALLFFDGVQVEAEGEAIDIECGETITSVYSASYEPNSHPNIVHFVIRELPIITAGIARLDVNDPRITEIGIISDTNDRAFVETIHLSNTLSFDKSDFSNLLVETEQREENDLIEHYLYSDAKDTPTSVALLGKDQNVYDFGVRFQNLFDDSDPFTITCLLDDVQQATL